MMNQGKLDVVKGDMSRINGKLNFGRQFTTHHILSQPEPEWTGETGYIKGELLRRLLPPLPQKDNETHRLVCICGPKPFTTLATDLFKENKYNENHLHLFLA
ncbi:unnamed protein product [Rotaria magnacalcarata]|uniref:Oxidoreductase FAD/NAD(P)-binding domain-containing protein n=1 Tax=Rotaria magnacalcarata TaxID=392030 RepID=A0A819ZL56_9BILA|nr:unnamed protein product [Rotaria magnacalcarata]